LNQTATAEGGNNRRRRCLRVSTSSGIGIVAATRRGRRRGWMSRAVSCMSGWPSNELAQQTPQQNTLDRIGPRCGHSDAGTYDVTGKIGSRLGTRDVRWHGTQLRSIPVMSGRRILSSSLIWRRTHRRQNDENRPRSGFHLSAALMRPSAPAASTSSHGMQEIRALTAKSAANVVTNLRLRQMRWSRSSESKPGRRFWPRHQCSAQERASYHLPMR
jgi:hypothetical protein